jgi:hypothetical protein
MTTTQRTRPARQPSQAPDPASRGLILVGVAVVLGIILLIKGGGVGFDTDDTDVEIRSDQGAQTTSPENTTTTVPAPPATSVAPSELMIVALNASGITGYAGQAQQFLSIAGYSTVTPITAATPNDTTTVYFVPGFEADALAVSERFGLPPGVVQPLPEDASLARNPAEYPDGAQVAIVLGPDVASILQDTAVEDPGAGQPPGVTETTIAGT